MSQSSSSDSERDVAIFLPNQESPSEEIEQPLRRSKRTTKGKHSNPFKLPRSIMAQQQIANKAQFPLRITLSIELGQIILLVLTVINTYCFSRVLVEKSIQHGVLAMTLSTILVAIFPRRLKSMYAKISGLLRMVQSRVDG